MIKYLQYYKKNFHYIREKYIKICLLKKDNKHFISNFNRI